MINFEKYGMGQSEEVGYKTTSDQIFQYFHEYAEGLLYCVQFKWGKPEISFTLLTVDKLKEFLSGFEYDE